MAHCLCDSSRSYRRGRGNPSVARCRAFPGNWAIRSSCGSHPFFDTRWSRAWSHVRRRSGFSIHRRRWSDLLPRLSHARNLIPPRLLLDHARKILENNGARGDGRDSRGPSPYSSNARFRPSFLGAFNEAELFVESGKNLDDVVSKRRIDFARSDIDGAVAVIGLEENCALSSETGAWNPRQVRPTWQSPHFSPPSGYSSFESA